jgi:CBS domain-containing protein/predicted Zn-ribbon and HTH transcriptional regulator
MDDILVADVMTREPVTIKPGTNLLDCAKKMVKKKVGSLIISDNKKLLGIISQKDILWALVKKSKKGLPEIRAIDISPKKIIKVRPDINLKQLIEKIKKSKTERLPVVLENELVGMVTVRDVLNFHPEFYPELEEFARIREESKKLKRIKEAQKRSEKEVIRDGVCEECGYEGGLHRIDGMLLCDSCRNSK